MQFTPTFEEICSPYTLTMKIVVILTTRLIVEGTGLSLKENVKPLSDGDRSIRGSNTSERLVPHKLFVRMRMSNYKNLRAIQER